MATNKSFRIGRVTAYLRGRVWYLRYHEQGKRRQVRAAADRSAVRQLAAQVNAQLELGSPAVTSFEPITVVDLRRHWLEHHEQVLRSSLATINRYRAATDHLLDFVSNGAAVKHTSHFRPLHAEQFVSYLRQLKVAPNGHPNAQRRQLRPKGIKYILEGCRTLFNFAIRRRHLPPHAENPFTTIQIDRMPVEDSRPFMDLDAAKEQELLEACDNWQFPMFLTLLLTGLRPGELTHLLLPDDLNLTEGWLYVCNKPDLGWQVKTRNERKIPLLGEVADTLRYVLEGRQTGPVYLRRRFAGGSCPPAAALSREQLQSELARRVRAKESQHGRPLTRQECHRVCHGLWRDMGAIKPDRVRTEFMKLTRKIGLSAVTAPKTLRHLFATALQDSNVDPLIRNQLMGHTPATGGSASGGLGMTGVYTHTRPQTLRSQLEAAQRTRPAVEVARRRLASRQVATAEANRA